MRLKKIVSLFLPHSQRRFINSHPMFEKKGFNAREFILENTKIVSPTLVPEIKLYLADGEKNLFESGEERIGELFGEDFLPYFFFSWSGGQSVSRFLLDNPKIVEEKNVLDFGSGCGIQSIASVKCGSKSVIATEIDPMAEVCIQMNLALNGIGEQKVILEDVTQKCPVKFINQHSIDVIILGDLLYEASLANRILDWLRKAKKGKTDLEVILSDSKRVLLDKKDFDSLQNYKVKSDKIYEDLGLRDVDVCRLN